MLKLLPAGAVDDKLTAKLEDYDARGSMARIHLLIDELPDYIGFPKGVQGPQHQAQAIMGASIENFERAWEAERRGEIPDDFVIEAVIQSTHDSTLAPEGRHTMTLGVQQLPFELAGTDWDTIREDWADRVLEVLYRYAPNLRGHILERVIITPKDLERDYGLTGGNIFHGSMFFDQLFNNRPMPELADYRTTVDNYYLCGSGTHPGGGVMGANGHNAAQVVIADLNGTPAPLHNVSAPHPRPASSTVPWKPSWTPRPARDSDTPSPPPPRSARSSSSLPAVNPPVNHSSKETYHA